MDEGTTYVGMDVHKRMIAATVLRMWKDEKEYDPERAGPSTVTREG